MKTILKHFSVILLFFIIIPPIHAQEDEEEVKPAIKTGNVLIDIYYSWPNLWSWYMENNYPGLDATNINTFGFGPIGGRVEYMLSDEIGLGANVSYGTNTVEWKEKIDTFMYSYKITHPRLRVLLRLTYHVVQNEQLDAYAVLGVGNIHHPYNVETDDPSYDFEEIMVLDEFNSIPLSLRGGIGVHYFLSDKMGFSLEIGLFGPLLTGGLAIRL